MSKVCGTICLVILPLLFVMGVFRVVGSDSNTSFLPSFDALMVQFSSAPDLRSAFVDAVNTFSDAYDQFQLNAGSVTDINSFFSAVGSFFNLAWNASIAVWKFLIIPVRAIVYIVGLVFGVATA